MKSGLFGSHARGLTLSDLIPEIPALRFLSDDFSHIEMKVQLAYVEFLQTVLGEKSAQALTDQDLNQQEKIRLKKYADIIRESLNKGLVPTGDDMDRYRETLNKAYARKVIIQRRIGAINEINAPVDDAKKFLTDKEYPQFLENLRDAADAYLDGGKGCLYSDWHFDLRAVTYGKWTSIIQERKEREIRHKRADDEFQQFRKRVADATEQLKKDLRKTRRPQFTYPPEFSKYEPGKWTKVRAPEQEDVERWAKPFIQSRIPPILQDLVCWGLEWQVLWLPFASYEVNGVPFLNWHLAASILVKVHITQAKGTFSVEFSGYKYQIILDGAHIGSLFLGPVDWASEGTFSTPIALLAMLAEGKLESDCIEVKEHSDGRTNFYIQGYDKEFTAIDERFRQFILDITKGKTLVQGLLDAGMIDELTGQLLAEKVKMLLPPVIGPETGSKEITDDDIIAVLEGMGFKHEQVQAAILTTHFSGMMTLEERVAVVLGKIVP